MKLKREEVVNVPPLLAVRTEVLVELIGSNKVIELFENGTIVGGQRRHNRTKKTEPEHPLSLDEEAILARLEADQARGLEEN